MRGRRLLIAWAGAVGLAVVLVPFGAGASGTPSFGPERTVATLSGVGALTEMESGDLNGDGVADLVVTRIAFPIAPRTFPIGIYLGDGKGGFKDGSSMWDGPAPRTEHGRQILIADFNGDRRNDIFVADHGYDAAPFSGHANALALSTAAGKLVDASANLPAESGFSHSAAAADVNRDGALDLYVGNMCCGDTPPEILLNDGSGRFSRAAGFLPPELASTRGVHQYTRALFADVNGDVAPDLVLGAFSPVPDSAVLLNDGSGHLRFLQGAMPAKPLGPRSILISLATLDINRDGHPDLLAGFQREDFSGRRLQVLIGDGTGAFRDETTQRLPSQDQGAGWPYAIRTTDVNGDGQLDFGVSLNGTETERAPLYLADSTGVYHPTQAPSSRSFLIYTDTDRDGRPDIVSATGGDTERIDVQLQLAIPTAPGKPKLTPLRDRIRLTWTATRGATNYEVWRAAPTQTLHRLGTTTAPKFDDRNTKRGVRYTYTLRAINTLGKSPFSPHATTRRT